MALPFRPPPHVNRECGIELLLIELFCTSNSSTDADRPSFKALQQLQVSS
jgi:hypothetical protein